MNAHVDVNLNELLSSKVKYVKHQLLALLVIAAMTMIVLVLTFSVLFYAAVLIGALALIYLLIKTYLKHKVSVAIGRYELFKQRVKTALAGNSSLVEAKSIEKDMQSVAYSDLDSALKMFLEKHIEMIKRQVLILTKRDYCNDLSKAAADNTKQAERLLSEQESGHPLVNIKQSIAIALANLRQRKQEFQDKWDEHYEQLSWWGKLSNMDGPDFSQLNRHINQLQAMQDKFEIKYQPSLNKLKKNIAEKKSKSKERISESLKSAQEYVNSQDMNSLLGTERPDYMLQVVGWCSAFGLSQSLWADFITSHEVYDALRNVNGNFANLSDGEIWYEPLWMSDESLTGLASLTKGAYFEQLVANDTGGELFEHFNNPGTDITISGIEYQIKATDSVTYVESVNESIPVIATSEVAELTNTIDGGYSNEELSESVALALGGTGVNIFDGVADGVLAGLGGLGTFATLRGIYLANELYNNGTDAEEAIFSGVGVAVKGTAKAVVDVSEMAYNVTSSRPSRFLARSAYKLARKAFK